MKRASKGDVLPNINPLVDLYNSVSLRYGVPLGGEDVDCIEGTMRLGVVSGGQEFYPLGAEESMPTLEGEVCYYDDKGAICRCLNWREAQRTMLTENTKNAILVTEVVSPSQMERSKAALLELKNLIETYYGVEATMVWMTA